MKPKKQWETRKIQKSCFLYILFLLCYLLFTYICNHLIIKYIYYTCIDLRSLQFVKDKRQVNALFQKSCTRPLTSLTGFLQAFAMQK